MGYHINLYSVNKKDYQDFNFDMSRFQDDENIDSWDAFNTEFKKVFKREVEIGNFLNFENYEKIISSYGNIHVIDTDDGFLDIIKQYNKYEYDYATKMVDSIFEKMMGVIDINEDRILMVKLRDYFQSKTFQYDNFDNNLCIDRNEERLTNGWRFESDMIELVRIYKSIDFNKKILISVGS